MKNKVFELLLKMRQSLSYFFPLLLREMCENLVVNLFEI